MFIVNKYQNSIISLPMAKQVQEIYESNFPAAERAPFESLEDGVVRGTTWLYCIGQDGQISGFATVNPLSRGNIFFLGYIAIARSYQSMGLGSLLLQAIGADLEKVSASGILFEVESPEEAKTKLESETRLRRIQFYEKNGGELVEDGGIYRMPDLTGPGSLGMRLMWIPILSTRETGLPIKLRDLLTLVYREMYDRGVDDPLVRTILAQLP